MDKEQIRLECLKLSVSRSAALDEQLGRAGKFYEFVMGQAYPDNAAVSGAGMTAGKNSSPPGKTVEVGPKSS